MGRRRKNGRFVYGTEAAELTGVQNNKDFVETFVATGQILPVCYPGKQAQYLRIEVEALIEKNRYEINEENFQTINGVR